ncbi:MAG: nuclear transport factor 2 family protein [Alphaproteobacteria bacterium]|nr:nuclear transport factor 2 family protein [Alphaproteobacteria bacterium]
MADAQRALDHIDIYTCMSRYCHGVDRCDLEVLKSAFWPDGSCNYSDQDLDAMTWAENCVAGISQMERTLHTIGNHLIEVDGDKATGETYCLAYHLLKNEKGELTDMLVGGRYLDHFEKRGGEWRIKSRYYVMDWNHNIPSTGNWTTGLLGGLNTGARMPNDPYYKVIG